MCAGRIGLGWAHDVFTIAFLMLMHFHAYLLYIPYILIYLNYFGTFPIVSFSPPHCLVYVSASWHQNISLFCPRTLFVPGHPFLLIILPHTSSSMMRRPKRTSLKTSLDEAFIWYAKSSCRTSSKLTYPLSFTVGDGNHCGTSQSLVHPCWYRSFTPTCMVLIFQYLSFLLAFEVRALWSLQILCPTCSTSRG